MRYGKIKLFRPGSNWGPSVCKTEIITTRPLDRWSESKIMRTVSDSRVGHGHLPTCRSQTPLSTLLASVRWSNGYDFSFTSCVQCPEKVPCSIHGASSFLPFASISSAGGYVWCLCYAQNALQWTFLGVE